MTVKTGTDLQRELLTQEHRYLEAVQRKDGDAAARLTAPESLVVSARGPMRIDAATLRQMVADHDGSSRYEIDEKSVQVMSVSDDVAVIAYKLRTMPSDGEATEAYDTDLWVRRDGLWTCALHTEIPAA